MVLPNFLCVGAEKAGTTPLFRILSQHRDVFMPRSKETHFFTRGYQVTTLAFYEAHYFKGYRGQKAVGEATPEYMRFPEVPARLRRDLGADLKLIFCLRDPVKRAFSQYHLRCRLLEENKSFVDAILLEKQRIAENAYVGRRQSYIGGSLYAEQIGRFLEHFPKQNMRFVILETDLMQSRAATAEGLFAFLGVEPDPVVRLEVVDSSNIAPRIEFQYGAGPRSDAGAPERSRPSRIRFHTGKGWADSVVVRPSDSTVGFFRDLADNLTVTLSAELAAELYRAHFAGEIERIENLIGRDLSVWRH